MILVIKFTVISQFFLVEETAVPAHTWVLPAGMAWATATLIFTEKNPLVLCEWITFIMHIYSALVHLARERDAPLRALDTAAAAATEEKVELPS